jgi:hypothetical protein
MPAGASGCLGFGETVTLTGSYAAAVLPVADGVTRDVRTDAGRRADVLTLSAPICVDADVVSTGVQGTLTVQLHCPVLELVDGTTISLTGRLVGAHIGNGHAPVLLACDH